MGLWNIIRPTNTMLFENTDGSNVLAVLSTLILLASLIMTLTAILQGLGYTFFPAMTILGCVLVKYGLNMVLVPMQGTLGAAVSSCLSLLIILILLIVKLRTIMGEFIINKHFYRMIGLAAIMMMVVLKSFLFLTGFIYDFGYSVRFMASIQALGAVITGGFTYLILILRGNIFKEEELSLLPFGSKLMALLPKGNRR